jgi:hypothetical protein
MAGYIRSDTSNNIADGNIINAADLDGEFDSIQAAFVNTTGHTHDGTAAEGAPITKIGPTQDVIAGTTTLNPKTTNTIDLGSSGLRFKDIYAAGTAYVATLDLTNALAVADGGTGANTFTANNVLLGNGTSAFQVVAPGTAGNILTSNGTTWQSSTPTAGVSTISFGTTGLTPSTATNGAVTVAGTLTVGNGGTGAATLTGVVKGNGTSAFTAGNVNLASEVTGTLPIANGGTGATTLAGANIPVVNAANTFTALQTFSGSTSVAAAKLTNAKEVATVSATAATGTIAYDVTTQSVLYYTSNASANWTVNFRGSSGTSLNTLMDTGESITVAFLVTQGATAYYNNVVQVDGSAVTPKYQGGTAWAAGNASSIDAYVYTIVKTGSAAFTVFASQTRFA